MTPGTLIFDEEFKFHDGADGKKILVILGTSEGITIAVKTTSKGARYLNTFGCQHDHRFPNFHLVANCCCLPLPTWICLNEFYELNDKVLLQKRFNQQIKPRGVLPTDITLALIQCALESDDISSSQEQILVAALDRFQRGETSGA